MKASIEKGQGFVEYALIFAFVVLVVIVVLWLFGNQVGSTYSNIITTI